MPIILEKYLKKNDNKRIIFTTQNHFNEIDEFVYSLDVLYILDAIKVDFDKGVVTYVLRIKSAIFNEECIYFHEG